MKTITLPKPSSSQHGDLIRILESFTHSESDGRGSDYLEYPEGTYALVDLSQLYAATGYLGDDLMRLEFDLPDWILEKVEGIFKGDVLDQDPMFPNSLTLQTWDFDALTEFELIYSPEKPFSWYVNTYLCDKGYGGPEEGGWYFDCGVPVESIGCNSHLDGRLKQIEINKRNDELNQNRPEISSVSSEGRYYATIEKKMGEAYPKTKPHYE
tara:strand:- start:838 stop:1470 length:633 start_codon:yes stop_codon:yes gene_type:complete